MKKKLASALILTIALCMLLASFLACAENVVIDELAEYKSEAKTTLTEYPETKTQALYTDENWTDITKLVESGKKAIDEAVVSDKIDCIVSLIKRAIDVVPEKMENTITEVNGITGLGSYAGLAPEIELEIIKTCLGESYNGQESVDKWKFNPYYGNFDGYEVFIRMPGWVWGNFKDVTIIIDNLHFISKAPGELNNPWKAWKDGQLYNLKSLYDEGSITKVSLEKLYIINIRINQEYYGELINNGYMMEVFNGLYYEGVDSGFMTNDEIEEKCEQFIEDLKILGYN